MPTIKQRKIKPRVKVIYREWVVGKSDLESQINTFIDWLLENDHWNGGLIFHSLGDDSVLIEWMKTTGSNLVDTETGKVIAEETPSGIVTPKGLKLLK